MSYKDLEDAKLKCFKQIISSSVRIYNTEPFSKSFKVVQKPEFTRIVNRPYEYRVDEPLQTPERSQRVKENISEFFNKIQGMIPNELYIGVIRKINSTKVRRGLSEATWKEKRNFLLGTAGVSYGDSIFVTGGKETLFHEMLHSITTYQEGYWLDNETFVEKYYSGFRQLVRTYDERTKKWDSDCSNVFGVGLNEGMTEKLAADLAGGKREAYNLECNVLDVIELIVGKDRLRELYFQCDLQTLSNMIDPSDDKSEFRYFISLLDYINTENNSFNGILNPKAISRINKTYRLIGKYLTKQFSQMLVREYTTYLMDGLNPEEIYRRQQEEINQFYNLMNKKVDGRRLGDKETLQELRKNLKINFQDTNARSR